jgi:myo-inositol 2-dehydrogenase/D-chiro-inositol 1-dehydrogenase
MGIVHARLLRDEPDVDGIVMADTDERRLREAAAELRADAAADSGVAIRQADAVIIATPPRTHAPLVRMAVQHRRPTLCEKPLAEDAAESEALATLVESSGVPVQVGFHRRFDPGYAAARELVASAALGRLQLIRLHGTEPVLPRSPLTNLFRNTAIHDFDLVRWLSGSEVVSIHVEGSHRDGGEFDRQLDPDTIVAAVQLATGAVASISVSRLSPLGYDVRAELVGDRDHISIGWTDRTPVRSVEPGAPAVREDRWQSWQDRFADAYREQISAFLAAARGEEDVRATVRDGVEAQRIAEAARASFAAGRRVVIRAAS